jgi:hypothetical protein
MYISIQQVLNKSSWSSWKWQKYGKLALTTDFHVISTRFIVCYDEVDYVMHHCVIFITFRLVVFACSRLNACVSLSRSEMLSAESQLFYV